MELDMEKKPFSLVLQEKAPFFSLSLILSALHLVLRNEQPFIFMAFKDELGKGEG